MVRFIGRIEARARADLEAWHHQRRMNVTMLVNVLRDLAIARRDAADPAQFALRTDTILTRAGGVDGIITACDEHLAKGHNDWRHFWNSFSGNSAAGSFASWRPYRWRPSAQHSALSMR